MGKRQRQVPMAHTERQIGVTMVVSGYMNELIARLHDDHKQKEWSGIAKVKKMDGYYYLTDIIFTEQENSSGNTELTKAGLDGLLERLVEEDPTGIHERNCWLHSHHNMSVFWSQTDWNARNGFNDGNVKHRWSIVTSYNGDGTLNYKCALDVFQPIRVAFSVPIIVEEYDAADILKQRVENYEMLGNALASLEEQKQLELSKVDVGQNSKSFVDLVSDLLFGDKASAETIAEEETKELQMAVEELIEAKFDREKDELISTFGGDIYEKKVKELNDNEQKPAYHTLYTPPKGKQPSLVDPDGEIFGEDGDADLPPRQQSNRHMYD